jgi:hypothetical protein
LLRPDDRCCGDVTPPPGTADIARGDGTPRAGTRVAVRPIMRCAVVMLVVGTGVAACDGVGAATAADPRAQFVAAAWPALNRCVGCHQRQPGVEFLAPGTADAAYDTLFGFQPPVLDLTAPASSLLVTIGQHTGPALAAWEYDALVGWIEAEAEARLAPGLPPVVVGPLAIVLGQPVTFDLTAAGAPGAAIDLVPEALGTSGLAVRGLTVRAGAAALRLIHPVFVAADVVDPIDRFAELDLRLAAAATADLGSELFLGLPPGGPLSIHIHAIEVTP